MCAKCGGWMMTEETATDEGTLYEWKCCLCGFRKERGLRSSRHQKSAVPLMTEPRDSDGPHRIPRSRLERIPH